MRESPRLQKFVRLLVEYRLLLSIGLSLACGIVLHTLYPARIDDPLLHLIAYEQPKTFRVMVQGYDLFLYTTPFPVLLPPVLAGLRSSLSERFGTGVGGPSYLSRFPARVGNSLLSWGRCIGSSCPTRPVSILAHDP